MDAQSRTPSRCNLLDGTSSHYDPATGKVDSLTVVGSNGPFGPAISPDGTRIAFSRLQSDVWRGQQIVTMATDGTDLRACTADSGVHDGNPHWSPDGKYLAFTRGNYTVGGSDVFVVKADGTGLRNLTEQGLSWVLDWSPDGSPASSSSRTKLASSRPGPSPQPVAPSSPSSTNRSAMQTTPPTERESRRSTSSRRTGCM